MLLPEFVHSTGFESNNLMIVSGVVGTTMANSRSDVRLHDA
jgi:hypothetical protein